MARSLSSWLGLTLGNRSSGHLSGPVGPLGSCSLLGYTGAVESAGASETYSRSEIRRILGIDENRLRSWERSGLTETQDRYSFSDLISLRTLQNLRENNTPPRRIREALEQLRLRLADVKHPLHELKIVSDGRNISVELPGEKMEAITGQMLFDFEADKLRSVSTLDPESDAEQPETGEAWFQHALELESSGTPAEEVIQAYEKVLRKDPQAAGAWINIGTLQYRQGWLERAEQSYHEALRAYPEYALAHFNLGNVCDDLGRLDEAAEHYEAALRCQRDYADAHFNLALVQERRKHFLVAAKHLQAYLNLDSSSPWSKIARRKRKSLLGAAARGDAAGGESLRKPYKDARD